MLMKIRTVLFYVCWGIATAIWSLLILAMIVLPYRRRLLWATGWADTSIWLARVLAGIDYQVHGREHLPDRAMVFASNHQSTWETLFLPTLWRDQVWVLKKELIQIPIFGWAMALLRPIAIDRSQRKQAMQQVIEQGRAKIEAGLSVVMYPEGHRFAPEVPLKFKSGAARLAHSLQVPIIPIAHNAGQFWPRRGWLHSGTVQVFIGKAIDPADFETVEDLNQALEDWVRAHRDQAVQAENARRGVSA